MKQIFTALMCMVAVAMFTACGGNANKKNADGTTETKSTVEVVSEKWPVNEYTKLIPKLEGVTITGNQATDNAYFVGHDVVTSGWSIADCKAYAEQVKKAGFTIPGAGSDDVAKETATSYTFGAENSDGVAVSLYTNGSNGGISIQKSKNSN